MGGALARPVVARESPSCRDCSCRQVASIKSACGPLGFRSKGLLSVNGENAPSQQIVPRVVAYLSILLGITSRRMRSICGRRGGPLYLTSTISHPRGCIVTEPVHNARKECARGSKASAQTLTCPARTAPRNGFAPRSVRKPSECRNCCALPPPEP